MKILCETSVRHVHLSKELFEKLFGKTSTLGVVRELSQKGQFLSDKRVSLVGPVGRIDNVAVLGPFRTKTQVEISITDSFALGIKAPLRESGNLDETPGIKINDINISEGVIIAKRHIHFNPEQAKVANVKNGQVVKAIFANERGGELSNIVVRVDPNYSAALHIDTDEGNALGNPIWAEIIDK